MSLTTRERGAYTPRGGEAFIRVEKCVTNLGGLYSGKLIHGGGLLTEFYGVYNGNVLLRHFTILQFKVILNKAFIAL